MLLLAISLATVLAAAVLPVLRGLVAADRSALVWPVVPLSAIVAVMLQWSASELVTMSIMPTIGLAVVAVVLTAQFAIDLLTHRLPRELSYAGLVVFALTIPFADAPTGRLIGALVGALVMTAIALAIVAATRGSLGLGDVHFCPLLGALLGWFGFLVAVAFAWVATAFLGGVVVAIGLATRRLRRSDHVPYGPFLVLGTVLSCVAIAVVHR